MRAQIKDVLLPSWRMDFKGQLGPGFRQGFPRQARDARFVRDRSPGRHSQSNRGRLEALRGTKDSVPFLCGGRDGQMDGLAFLLRQRQGLREQVLLVDAEKLVGRKFVLARTGAADEP